MGLFCYEQDLFVNCLLACYLQFLFLAYIYIYIQPDSNTCPSGLVWALLGSPGLSWALPGSPGLSWAPLVSPGLVWALLARPGSPGLSWVHLGFVGQGV
jgi:hypothetical protein